MPSCSGEQLATELRNIVATASCGEPLERLSRRTFVMPSLSGDSLGNAVAMPFFRTRVLQRSRALQLEAIVASHLAYTIAMSSFSEELLATQMRSIVATSS